MRYNFVWVFSVSLAENGEILKIITIKKRMSSMKPIALFLVFLFLFSTAAAPATADIFECGHGDDEERSEYPYDPSGEIIKTKVIYVGFPGGQDSTLVPEFKAAVDTLKWYFASHSHGRLQYSEDSDIVLAPGQAFGDLQNPPIAWMAELSAAEYRTPFLPPEDYAYTGLTDTWYNTTSCGAALNAEILYKIREAYPNNTEIFEETDRLVINYLTPSPDSVFPSGVGGYSKVYINPYSLPSDYFGFSKKDSSSVFGSQQNTNLEEGAVTWDAADVAYPMAHEAAHALGPGDGPPRFSAGSLEEGRYYFGNLNLMDQRRSDREGLPPVGIGWLQDIPWQEGGFSGVFDFTGQAFRDTVFDIRTPRGKIFKFRIDPDMCLTSPFGDQYFLIAYHAGSGIDGVVSLEGNPLMRSTGLEIMHCYSQAMFDLESAFGLFSNPSVDEFNMDPGYWSIQDTESGYDNHDWWDVSPGNERDGDEYGEYIGESFDFFRINLAGADSVFNKPEFSYDSNPNCFGYKNDGSPVYRRNPQSVPNSLRVKILEQNDDEGWMIVDFSTAPYGDLLYPDDAPGLAFEVGDTIDVRWSNDFGDAIDRVDVMFFPFNDGIPQILVADFAVSAQDTVFSWIVGPEHVSIGGKLKVVFKNPYTRYVTADSTMVVVNGDVYPAETIITPTVGSEFYTGVNNQVKWTKRFRSFPEDTLLETSSVDFLFSAEGGADGTWDTLATGSTFFQELDNYNSYQWAPELDMQTSNGKIRLVFHTKDGEVAMDECDVVFPVFPLGAHFSDDSREVGELNQYSGQPYSGVSVDYDLGGNLDLFVSIDDPGISMDGTPVLYRNIMIGHGGLPDFLAVTFSTFSPLPPAYSHGVSMGDYDQDGHEDIILTNKNVANLYHFEGGGFVDVLANSFPPAPADSLLENTYCATWVDFDHDGDLDLYLGRMAMVEDSFGGLNIFPLRDALYQNQGPDSNFTFVEVGQQVGLVDSLVVSATQTAVWSDLDKDHFWEVFIGDAKGHGANNQMFEQQPSGQFLRLSNPFPVPLGAIKAAKLVDVNNSGNFELVLLNRTNQLIILEDFQSGFNGYQVLESSGGSNNIGVLDYDLDGWLDFLLPASYSETTSTFWANLQGNSIFDEPFLDFSTKIGISDPVGDVGGLVVADFTGDGDQDLFLGASSSGGDGRYFQNSAPEGGGDAPLNHWLGIQLVNCQEDPTTNLGAVVTVAKNLSGVVLGMQQLDGGSGRGGQADRTLTFGLGSHGDDPGDAVSVAIDWPNGETMDFQIFSADLDSVIEITKNTEFSIDTSSVQLKTSFDINQPGKLDFSFSWITDGLTQKDLDEVQLTPVSGSSCPFGPITLEKDYPGVVVQEPKYQINPATGKTFYGHLLIWENVDCQTGCSFNFSVFSSTGCRSDSYTKPRPFTISVCPSTN